MSKKASKRTKPAVAKKQTQAKKKPSPPPSIMTSAEYLHDWLCTLFPVACAIEKGIDLINKLTEACWEFLNLQEILTDLLSSNDGNLFVVLGTQAISKTIDGVTTGVLMPVVYVIIAPQELKELPNFLRRKAYRDSNKSLSFDTFESLKYHWKNISDRVFGLHCKRPQENLKKLSEEQKALYAYSNLADVRNSKAFPVGRNGKLEVEFVSFDCTFPNGIKLEDIIFDKECDVYRTFIPTTLDGEDDLENNEANHKALDKELRKAFADKRASLQRNKEWVHGSVSNVDALEDVTCVKVYPSNAAEALSKLDFATKADNFSTKDTDLDYAINPQKIYPEPKSPVNALMSHN